MKFRRKTGKDIDSFGERRFTNQNWKRVLREIMNYAPNRYGRGKPQSYQDDHPLAKRLKIKGYEVGLIMAFLEDQGLIEYDKPDYNWINLTSKGFDVALQNQSADKANIKDKATLFLSLVIALAVISSLLVGIENLGEKWAVTVVFVLAVVIGGYLIKRSF